MRVTSQPRDLGTGRRDGVAEGRALVLVLVLVGGYVNNFGKLRDFWRIIDYSPPGHAVALPLLFIEKIRS